MDPEPCPICGVVDCGGTVYPHLIAEYRAGRNRDHWRRVHDRREASSPEDLALREYVAKHGCCGGKADAS